MSKHIVFFLIIACSVKLNQADGIALDDLTNFLRGFFSTSLAVKFNPINFTQCFGQLDHMRDEL